MKNIIITSGGTSEPIDSIRKITNSSSGKLGAVIAETIDTKLSNEVENIYYICARKSIIPQGLVFNMFNTKMHIIYADSTQEIFDILKDLLTDETKNITHVIHARAISDYEVDFVTSTSILRSALEYEDWGYALDNCYCDELLESSSEEDSNFEVCKSCEYSPDIQMDTKGKISSYHDDLIIKLKKTPKIISYIKQWNPNIVLVGFKLLDSVPIEELFGAAYRQMRTNDCDFVVANDISQIRDGKHIAHIINKEDNEFITVDTKEEIASEICDIIKYY